MAKKDMPILSMPNRKQKNDKYNLGKYAPAKEKEDELQEALQDNKIMPSFRTAEMRMYFGEFPKMKRTQEDLNQCQTLIAGAVQLMYDRLMGKTEFDISERQYNQFLCDAKEKTKLFTWGYETLDETAEWVFDAINVEYEPDNDDIEE